MQVSFLRSAVSCALLFFSQSLLAAVINFSGALVFEDDSGGAIFSGSGIGTQFTGSIDDATFGGSISNGSTSVLFGCCIAAGGLSVSNDEVLNADEAALINSLLGMDVFSDGSMIDIIDIEGDTVTSGEGRIEVGLSYLFDSSTFADESLGNYPFDPNDVLLTVYFIFEEDVEGATLYDAIGVVTAVPVPAAAWFFISALVGLAGTNLSNKNKLMQKERS